MPADDNRRMFDAVARRYDLMNMILSLGLDRFWRRKAVRVLAPQPGNRILDIGSGTGDIAIEVVRQQPGATVTGIDPAVDMLELALKKITKCGFQDAIRVEPGDALKLQFADCSYDGVISAFCIRNLEDRLRAFSEMHRVLKPEGRVVVLELSIPENILWRTGYHMYSRMIVPFMGRLLSREGAYRYLVKSIEDYPDSETMLHKMQCAGFSKLSRVPITSSIVTLLTGRK